MPLEGKEDQSQMLPSCSKQFEANWLVVRGPTIGRSNVVKADLGTYFASSSARGHLLAAIAKSSNFFEALLHSCSPEIGGNYALTPPFGYVI